MAQIAHVAMTDSLKIELVGEEVEGATFTFSVFELINGTWQYLDSAPTNLAVKCSDGQIRAMLENLANTYMEMQNSRPTNALYPTELSAAQAK